MARKLIHLVAPLWPTERRPYFGTFVRNISDGLEARGWTVTRYAVPQSNRDGVLEKLERHIGIALGIARLAFSRRALVFVHSPSWFSILLWPIARIRKMPIAVHIHGSEIHARSRIARLGWMVTRSLIKRADWVISPSSAFSRTISEATGRSCALIQASPSGGIKETVFFPSEKSQNTLLELGFSPAELIVGYVSRITPGKGWGLFLDTLELLLAQDPSVRGLIIGAGSDETRLQAELEKRRLEDVIRYIGGQPHFELQRYFSVMDVFLFCSAITTVDSLGLVALESIACGVPVVALDHPITREYVVPGMNGLLCRQRTPKEYASAARTCLNWRTSRPRLREEISHTIEKYHEAAVMDELDASLQALAV